MSLEFSQLKKMNAKDLLAAIGKTWRRIHTWVFFVILFAAILLAGFIWRKSLDGQGWSAEKKQAYLTSQNTGVAFNENDYNKVLTDMKNRQVKSQQDFPQLRDIFHSYK